MAKVFAVTQGLRRNIDGFVKHVLREDIGNAVFMDRNQAERFGCERIAEHLRHPRANPWCPASFFGKYKVTRCGEAKITNQRLTPLAFIDRFQPKAVTLFLNNAEDQILFTFQFLERVRHMATARFFSARKDAVTHAECSAFAALNHAQAGRRFAFGLPIFRDSKDFTVNNINNAQHRDLGQPAHFVKRTARSGIDQPFIGHIFEQSLERNFIRAVKPKRFGNFTFSCGSFRCRYEIDDLFAARKPRAILFWHGPSIRAWRAIAKR